MTNPPVTDFFTKEIAEAYDERNKKLSAISDNMHFLIRLILQDLPSRCRVLCVGTGTGAEILSLAEAFLEWSFVAVEPSASMLEVCRARLIKAGLIDRCTLIHGYVQDAPKDNNFDVALSVLVAHFVKREERLDFFKNMTGRLKDKGYLINTEISSDLNSKNFPMILKNWEKVQTLMGATPESLQKLPVQLREFLSVLSPEETENILKESGLLNPIRFFQSFMITGWYGVK